MSKARPPRAQPAPGLRPQSWEQIALQDIDAEDSTFQYRLSTSTADLRSSLEAVGQQEPVDLVGERPYRIADGFRRVRAAKDLGWASIKAFVHRHLSNEEAGRLAFTKNVVRRNLSPLEKANAMFLAQGRGIRKAQLAEAFGISEKQVTRYLELAAIPEAIQKIFDGKVVTMAHAKVLADFGVRETESWRDRIVAEHLDARRLKLALRSDSGKKSGGRTRRYVQISGGGIRVYPFRVHKESPQEEKSRAINALQDALEALRQWSSR